MIGRELRLPLDLLFERPPDAQHTPTTTEYVRVQRDRMRIVRAQTEDNLKVAAGTMKRRTDLKASSLDPLQENDEVWLYNPKRKKGQSPKLSSPWEGPYRIVKRLSAVTYRIRKNRHAACKVVHFNRLWRIGGPSKFSWAGGLGSSDASDETIPPDDSPGQSGIVPNRSRAQSNAGIIPNHADATPRPGRFRSPPGGPAGETTPPDGTQSQSGIIPNRARVPGHAGTIPDLAAVTSRPRRSQRDRRPPSYLGYN